MKTKFNNSIFYYYYLSKENDPIILGITIQPKQVLIDLSRECSGKLYFYICFHVNKKYIIDWYNIYINKLKEKFNESYRTILERKNICS